MKILAKQSKTNTLNISDKDYPANLRYIYDPPATIYAAGNIIEQDNVAIAIVGCRRATSYGLKNAEGLAFELAARGITVVSGLARGVDSAAHQGALKAKGRTLAVLGSGLNIIYPPENKKLAQQIAENGAVISEFTADTPPLPQNFPRRNRIISGLSLGVVVVEAARKSGALITANLALEQGREVFALPGKIDSFASQGTHDLIKHGAKLVESVQDIIEELEPLKYLQVKNGESEGKTEIKLNLSFEEGKIYSFLSSEAIHIDEIMQQVALPFGKLLTALLQLQHKKLVKELPGKLFMRI